MVVNFLKFLYQKKVFIVCDTGTDYSNTSALETFHTLIKKRVFFLVVQFNSANIYHRPFLFFLPCVRWHFIRACSGKFICLPLEFIFSVNLRKSLYFFPFQEKDILGIYFDLFPWAQTAWSWTIGTKFRVNQNWRGFLSSNELRK